MEDQVKILQREILLAIDQLKIDDLEKKLQDLTKESQQQDFWTDNKQATATMQNIAKLEQRVKPWLEIRQSINDLIELIMIKDPKMALELEHNYHQISHQFAKLKTQLMFSGPYDDHDAVFTISSGAGGTDAQDWTQILFRMYVRFFDRNRWHYVVIEESPGEEAGLKSIVIEVSGNDFVYGKLKGEHGVHRLVRLSPFNADNLRQTSFAKVEVYPKIASPKELDIDTKDIKVDVYRSGGHGGQSVNTTDSAVRVTHIPSGISVAIQNERSQLQNRETAMSILRSRLALLQLQQHANKLTEIKGPNQSAEWGNQIRNYVMHPYKQVKDLRSKYESSDIDKILDGDIEPLIDAYLQTNLQI
jgi:peptide chain release factor 2